MVRLGLFFQSSLAVYVGLMDGIFFFVLMWRTSIKCMLQSSELNVCIAAGGELRLADTRYMCGS